MSFSIWESVLYFSKLCHLPTTALASDYNHVATLLHETMPSNCTRVRKVVSVPIHIA